VQKSAPSVGKILVAIGFALSCFGLLLFLWVAFGGPVPLKPESYRVKTYFPEAVQLAVESDVRIGGVSVGKVKAIELAPADRRLEGQDLTEAELEIDPKFAPISNDARAILRQKTLLGETYVELTSGTNPDGAGEPVALGAATNNSDAEVENVEPIPEGGFLGVDPETGEPSPALIRSQVQIDEIFNALDDETRASFQRWQQNAAVAIQDRGQDLNDGFGNLGPFLTDASDVLTILKRQKQELKGLVRDTGVVFEALTEREQALAGAIVNSNDTFDALASEQEALRQTFQVFPTFERESRATFDRLDAFQANTLPLVRDLQPVADDLSPTLRSIRELAPDLDALLSNDLEALVRATKKGLPDLASFVKGARPLLNSLDPFLANLNPVINWLEYYKTSVTDFLNSPPAALSGTLSPQSGQPGARHALRQLGYVSEQTVAFYENRPATNRGNGYLRPFDKIFSGGRAGSIGIFPSFDCDNSGVRTAGDGKSPPVGITFAPCFLAKDFPNRFGGLHGPQVSEDGAP
jgi:phospholipid/cholesterol/gamma-HCH transport system substrate-binding protein